MEGEFEQRFPADYLRFLDTANGAKLTENEMTAGGAAFVIERFLPILDNPKDDSANGWADVAVVASQLDTRLVIGEDTSGLDLIPIAALFASDFLVLDYRNSRQQPVVSQWDHEASTDFAPSAEPVAESFGAFERLL